MSEWKPINSAPTDGTFILAWCVDTGGNGGDEICVIAFDSGAEASGRALWKVSGTEHGRLFWCNPTHWMPLPSPPSQENGHE